MRVFVAGASGAIGRSLVPKLVAAGHEVTGMTRSEERAEAIARRAHARPWWTCSTAMRLRAAIGEAAPEVLVHELTSLPDRLDFRKEDIYEPHEPGPHRGHAQPARRGPRRGARRFVVQSIAFAYRPEGARVKTEEDPLMETRPGRSAAASGRSTIWSRRCWAPRGSRGWCSGTASSTGPAPTTARGHDRPRRRRRRMPIVGKGTGVFSFIHVDDAADATVAAVERGSPGVYNVTDDDPAPMREWLPVFAEAAGQAAAGVPVWLARFVGGRQVADLRARAARRLEREGEAGARLGAGPPELAPRASRSRCGGG